MKKLLSLLLVLSMLLPLCCAAANADAEPEAFISGDYKYTLNEDGTVCITEYSGEAETLEIPSKLDGKSVTTIGVGAFWGCASLESITVSDSITFIGDWAFFGCDSLASITIPDSVTLIGSNPFTDCIYSVG